MGKLCNNELKKNTNANIAVHLYTERKTRHDRTAIVSARIKRVIIDLCGLKRNAARPHYQMILIEFIESS